MAIDTPKILSGKLLKNSAGFMNGKQSYKMYYVNATPFVYLFIWNSVFGFLESVTNYSIPI